MRPAAAVRRAHAAPFPRAAILVALLPLSTAATVPASGQSPGGSAASASGGYYRQPALHGSTLVFVSEGDLWRVDVRGGEARRLTTGAGEESHPAISPDGARVAFTGTYEGPAEAYVMPMDGGVPERLTWLGGTGSGGATVVGWTPDGRVLVSTRSRSTLPNTQLLAVSPATREVTPVPLEQAADGEFTADGALVFTRQAFQGSHAKRYRGGTAQQLWVWPRGAATAAPLTADYDGTSKAPMLEGGRVYFLSDRDGTMNVWAADLASSSADGTGPGPADGAVLAPSATREGSGLRLSAPTQFTHEDGWDIREAALSGKLLVYRVGARLKAVDLDGGSTREIPITLPSDFAQRQERWITKPMDWLTSVALSPSGDRVALTARGQVFVAPAGSDGGRLVEVTRAEGVRYRNATWADGNDLVALSDESGEVELWRLPANGVGKREQLTRGGTILRWRAVPSPDGRYIAHTDKDARLWVTEPATGTTTLVARDTVSGDAPGSLAWSPDGRWLAFSRSTRNGLQQLWLWDARSGATAPITSRRYVSYSPAWSPDGRWLWFLSDRNFQSIVGSPWGSYQPEPYFDRPTRVYALALTPDGAFPMGERTELDADSAAGAGSRAAGAARGGAGARGGALSRPASLAGLGMLTSGERRLFEAPIPPGNYASLATDGKRLYVLDRDAGERQARLMAIELKKGEVEPAKLVDGVRGYELSRDGKKLLFRKGDAIYVVDAGGKLPDKLSDHQVDLSAWRFSFDPREEWRQMYADAWRLHRDYFWDPGMRGVDWKAIRAKYAPLVDRVTDREELADILGMMISELSTLHAFIRPGDVREGDVDVAPASLGAVLRRDEGAGGLRVAHVWRADPDLPGSLAPLARPDVRVGDGDVILAIDGAPTLSAPSPGALLRGKAGEQVLLRVRPAGGGAPRDVVVKPISQREAAGLRYDEWEYTRRLLVDSLSGGRIGYVHLRAMGSGDIAQFVRDFQAANGKEALLFDDRHNRGGNIDSWVLNRLGRRAWMWWKPRIGEVYPNMQQAFIGPMVTLVDQWTASDGEAFAEGFRRLGLGKVIGARTWGGEVWLTSSNTLIDNGLASAAEFGVYGPEGKWLIEGHGVDPDIVVDNDPAATWAGRDAQLERAVGELLRELAEHPVRVPNAPPWPGHGERR